MDDDCFDELSCTFSHLLSRRRLATALGLVATGPFALAAKNKNKRKKRKKLKKNEYGCVNVGGKCRGKDSLCCSGICQGKKPKKGMKDKSKCRAHNVLDCPPGADTCGSLVTCGLGGMCYQTTGQASFCAGFIFCEACQKDADCEPVQGPGAACVVCSGCPATGNTGCAWPAPEV